MSVARNRASVSPGIVKVFQLVLPAFIANRGALVRLDLDLRLFIAGHDPAILHPCLGRRPDAESTSMLELREDLHVERARETGWLSFVGKARETAPAPINLPTANHGNDGAPKSPLTDRRQQTADHNTQLGVLLFYYVSCLCIRRNVLLFCRCRIANRGGRRVSQ